MASRVLATQEAKNAIAQINTIVNGGLEDQISALNTQGSTLSDPNIWDGPTAVDFRSNVWPQINSALQDTKGKLDELRTKLDTITSNIMAAGGA
jgi:uncharacterized protein YukE